MKNLYLLIVLIIIYLLYRKNYVEKFDVNIPQMN